MRTALETILRTLWSSMFPGLKLESVEEPPRPSELGEVVAFVSFAGDWQGRVVLALSEQLARRLTARTYGCPDEQVPSEHVDDLVGELANVLGGNLVAALPGRPRISLPTVIRGEGFRISGRETREDYVLGFAVEGESILLRLIRG